MSFILKDRDATKQISQYRFDNKNSVMKVRYEENGKEYSYKYESIKIVPCHLKEIESDQVIVDKTNGRNLPLDIVQYKVLGENHNIICIDINDVTKYYKRNEIAIERFERYTLKDDEVFIMKDNVKMVDTIEFSDTAARITFPDSDKYYVMKISNVRIAKNMKVDFKNLFDYYKQIASRKDSYSQLKIAHYLEDQLNKIVIQKNDLLDIYFSKKKEHLKLNNEIDVIYPFGINLSQREAIKNALNHRISLIQGPPGTGKTQSILNIIANLIVQNKSVAVVSSNNEAVKNVLEKMESKQYNFLVALLGNKENKERFFENQMDYPCEILNSFINDEQMKKTSMKIKEHENALLSLLEYKNELAKLKQELYEYEHEYKYFSDYFDERDAAKLKRLRFFKLNSEKLIKILVDLNFPNTRMESIVYKFKSFIQYGIYDFKQYQDIAPVIMDIQNQYYKEKIYELKIRITEIEELLENKKYDTELYELQVNSEKYFTSFLAAKFKNRSRQKFHLKNYTYDTVFDEFIDEYPVILSTTHAISKCKNQNFKFDYLIIDEASQVELVPGIIALSTAKNVVIVGDKNQLPHIPEERIRKSEYKKWIKDYNISYEFDYYENSLLHSFDYIFDDDIKVLLREHYRCDRRIIEFCNRKYYDGNLICLSKKEVNNPLVLLKTAPGNHLRYGPNAANKITNVRELQSLVDEDFLKKINLMFDDKKSFGFIAPFRGQANVANKILPSEFQKDTVHKFQGRECDVIMFSSVLDKKVKSKLFMDFVDEPHLLNVAVSRAIEKFILVSNVDTFLEENRDMSDLIKYMEYYEDDCLFHESTVKSIFDLLYSDYADVLREKEKKRNWKKSKFDSENLLYELLDHVLDPRKYKYVREVRLKEMVQDDSLFTQEEVTYMKNNSRVDVIIYNVYDKKPLLAIEVDGFASHENNPTQLAKDKLKDSIFRKLKVHLHRFKTNESTNEEEFLKKYLS